jgi:hypothetical protein
MKKNRRGLGLLVVLCELSVNERPRRGGFLYGEESRMGGPLTRIAPSHLTELVLVRDGRGEEVLGRCAAAGSVSIGSVCFIS